jgi:hypothetical protein
MDGRQPKILDRIIINDFVCNETDGASAELTSTATQRSMEIGYEPQMLFGHPVLIWIPLHTKVRWSAPPSNPHKGSLGFPLTLRTMSRHHLRERGIVYCETGPSFGAEFDSREDS